MGLTKVFRKIYDFFVDLFSIKKEDIEMDVIIQMEHLSEIEFDEDHNDT